MIAFLRKAHIWMVLCKAITLLMIISVGFTQCSPTHENLRRRALRLRKDETRLENGTIVGKYSYKDKEGNPINVHYYADEHGYGVELKSVKVSESFENPDTNIKSDSTTEKKLEQTFASESGNMEMIEPQKKTLNHENHKEPNSITLQRTEQTGDDSMENMGNVFNTVRSNDRVKNDYRKTREYETFVERKVAGVPKKFSNKKIRIYSHENLRNARDTSSQKRRTKIY